MFENDPLTFAGRLLEQPLWLQAWIAWMGLVNMAAVLFLRRVEARWVLAALACSFVSMSLLYAVNGYSRLLGLAHVIWWTPLLVYLYPRLKRIERGTAVGVWTLILFATNAVSLAVDYSDVIRYLLGDRS